MTRSVFCRKYQKDMPGLDAPPYPGPKGLDVFENVSKQAWGEWLSHQTMLINEKHLNMMDMTARTYLQEQQQNFFSGDNVDAVEGYVPEGE
ncbi:MAG: oxidative damage protection protein [Cellvibrionaceae bacterium]